MGEGQRGRAEEPEPGPDEPVPEYRGAGRFCVRLPGDQSYRTLLAPARPGEVAMLVEQAAGWMLLQTKSHYPPGIFRLPTGTMNPGETPEQAMLRELHEEANLTPGRYRRLLRLDYLVEGGRQDMSTHLFLVEQPSGQLKSNDPEEAIEAWREAPLHELDVIADELVRLSGEWKGWGMYRAVLHRLAARELNKK